MAYITTANGSRQPMFLITTGVLLLMSTVTVSLRLFCRFFYINHVGLDDYFILAALGVAIGMGIMNGFHVSWGTGYEYKSLAPFMIFTFECRSNVSQAWSPTFPQGCNNLPATYFSTASINILTDIMILLMPVRAFSQLNLHRRKRWALLGIFMVGGIAVIASIIRLYALWVYTTTKDVSYDAIFILLLSQIEVNVAIISSSAPALRPLFNKTFMPTSYNRSNTYGNAYGNSGTASNGFPRSRAKSNGQMELHSFPSENNKRKDIRTTSNTSEEYILGNEGIIKTIKVSVDHASI
ncbi:hypothetical protein P280DRAFT_387716 [Massarina eburnea CBS 473.64]|uniref:Rhodopsin domain-containing protein n=1 Tax=Massarina eburnea CBS 473.64 TaxID=1395130 RepID=A0A6A6SIM4_9PLEO|nr:hypothetical protein P280DRAFT_387716 [Massarina eburnea CBS 473.64]